MACYDWKRYYGVVLYHKVLKRTFVNGTLYRNRDVAYEAASFFRLLSAIEVLGVVGIRGKANNPQVQRQLWERSK